MAIKTCLMVGGGMAGGWIKTLDGKFSRSGQNRRLGRCSARNFRTTGPKFGLRTQSMLQRYRSGLGQSKG